MFIKKSVLIVRTKNDSKRWLTLFRGRCLLFFFSSLWVQVYVQDILREQLNDKVFEVLHNNPGHLYICGGMNMAHDVASTIKEILVSRLGITLTQAEEYLSRLKVNLQIVDTFYSCFR